MTSLDKMSLDKMSLDKASLDWMSLNVMPEHGLSVGEMNLNVIS
jgi:hypothetical protein